MARWTDRETSELVRLYDQQDLPVDRLPYTEQFENLYMMLLANTGKPKTHWDVYDYLVHLRKQSNRTNVKFRLAPKGRGKVIKR